MGNLMPARASLSFRHAFALILACCWTGAAAAQWQRQEIKTESDFRGLSVVSDQIAWVSGTKGTFGRTSDGGKTWTVGTVPDAEKLDFRDVEAFGESTAYLMAAGPAEASRIYKTTDAGKTWALQFKNTDKDGFYDGIAFWDADHGIALGDPINGRYQLIATEDGGRHWNKLPEKSLPVAQQKEGAFAASGTCIVTHGKNDVWFCTGSARAARVFHSGDRGLTWTVSETPIQAGVDSAGVFSIAFRDPMNGIIVGGDYRKPNDVGATVALTTDGGKTWKPVEGKLPFRSGVARAKDQWVTLGASGSNASADGLEWKSLDRENYNSVAFTSAGAGWAAGPKGRVARYQP